MRGWRKPIPFDGDPAVRLTAAVGRVLKVSAEEMRKKRQQWAREKAAKLPVKILFPLVLFIFPSIFVVLLGPAASDIGAAFGGG